MLSQDFINEMKERLLEEKTRLEEELKGYQPHTELGDDMDDSAQEVADDEVSQDAIAAIKEDLEKIDRALEKIDDGTYGTDDDGKDISEDRLRAIPWADKAI